MARDVAPHRGRRARRRRKARGGIIAFLIASVIPIGAVVVVMLLPEDRRAALLAQIPEGVGGRALAAAAAFGLMAVLAWVALPAFHNASGLLRRVIENMRAKPTALRVLLFPLQFLVGLVWLVFQALFAMDAFLIVLSALIGLLLAIRIVEPGFLPGVLEGFPR